MIGLAIFGCASLLAAYAPSAWALIFARALLGMGAATLMPATLSIIALVFEDKQERSLAIGVWGAVASGAAAIGPLIGGALLEYFWWGSVFLINVPIVLTALILTARYVPHAQADSRYPWDLIGSLQFMLGLISFAYAIKACGSPAPSYRQVILAVVLALLLLACFVRRQNNRAHPLVDFKLLSSPAFSSALIASTIVSGCLMGTNLVLSQRLQWVQELSPLETGLYFLPMSLGAIVASPLSGWLLPRVSSARWLMIVLVTYALTLMALKASLAASLYQQLACLTLLGMCLGAALTAASTVIMLAAPAHRVGMAASLEEVSYELGAGMGVAIFGTLASVIYDRAFSLPPTLALDQKISQGLESALNVATGMADDTGLFIAEHAKSAFEVAVTTTLEVQAVMLLLAAVLLGFNFRRLSQANAMSTAADPKS